VRARMGSSSAMTAVGAVSTRVMAVFLDRSMTTVMGERGVRRVRRG
jgi:hypothetical protein